MYIETLPLVVWTLLLTTTHVATQNQYGIGLGIKREVFFLNLEDGYFGCQVNESTQILQLYELSKLCDGVPDCYKASDELRTELKCSDDCTKDDGARCINGACLNGVCHCNDGFGGCNCQELDVNECKDRPCDVFAHCTNTVGSFQCSCFPGYIGDGFTCKDINECEDPAISARCVKNAECCNLPAHFICKCNRGFEGDGEEECRGIISTSVSDPELAVLMRFVKTIQETIPAHVKQGIQEILSMDAWTWMNVATSAHAAMVQYAAMWMAATSAAVHLVVRVIHEFPVSIMINVHEILAVETRSARTCLALIAAPAHQVLKETLTYSVPT